ncbi:MAG: hypothetical protein K8R60_22585 [Burkholderiales bacterium]|nr:hypothetical protein [Burkholderiales bacterium]
MKRTIAVATNVSGSWTRMLAVALSALLCLGASLAARAQGGADVDPPDRVARLSEMSGQVWLFSPESNEWVAVARNRPLTTGDRIATDNGAHAELALGSTTLRLDSASELEVVLLDDNVFNVHLHSGSVAARLRNAPSVAEFVLDTDEGRFRAQGVGRYRFDRFEQTSDLTVDAGQAVFEGRNSALPLTAGQHAQFWLDASGAAQYNMVEPARDAFAAWNAERDRAEVRPTAAVRYVSPEMTGAEDLDRYGQWEQTADYGPIWTPRAVAVGWAPYSAGHWAYVRPWGWTWVDDAPWGFAPFHYGRWVNYRSRWCWVPGTYVARPVYAPALVAWVGGVSIAIGGGGRGAPPVGWFPLAPREVYVPSYRYSSPRYVRNINVTHVTNVTQITTIVNNTNGAADRRDFANRKFPHAVTVVPASVLTGRQPVAAEAARFRNDPQARALVSDAKPVVAMNAPPVAAPPAPARPPGGKVAITRPPFEGRAPGAFGGRPGQERGQGPGTSPQAGAAPQGNAAPQGGATAPQGTPAAAPGTAPVRPGSPAMAGRPTQAVPAQAVPPQGRPEGGRADGQRPESGRAEGQRPGEQRPPQPNAPPAPNVQASPGAPPASPNAQVAPPAPNVQQATPAVPRQAVADDRTRGGRRGTPDESHGRPGSVPPPPVTGAAPVAPPSGRGAEPRAADAPRPPPTVRQIERPADAPRVLARPVDREKAQEAARAAMPPRAAELPARAAPQPARAAEPRVAPAPAASPPPAPRHEDKPAKAERADKPDRPDRNEKGEKQR